MPAVSAIIPYNSQIAEATISITVRLGILSNWALTVPFRARAAEEVGGGGRRGSCPPVTELGGKHIIFPPEILKGPQR